MKITADHDILGNFLTKIYTGFISWYKDSISYHDIEFFITIFWKKSYIAHHYQTALLGIMWLDIMTDNYKSSLKMSSYGASISKINNYKPLFLLGSLLYNVLKTANIHWDVLLSSVGGSACFTWLSLEFVEIQLQILTQGEFLWCKHK